MLSPTELELRARISGARAVARVERLGCGLDEPKWQAGCHAARMSQLRNRPNTQPQNSTCAFNTLQHRVISLSNSSSSGFAHRLRSEWRRPSSDDPPGHNPEYHPGYQNRHIGLRHDRVRNARQESHEKANCDRRHPQVDRGGEEPERKTRREGCEKGRAPRAALRTSSMGMPHHDRGPASS